MQIIKDGCLVENGWVHLDDDAALPETGPVTVSASRWLKERDALRQRRGELGLRMGGGDDLDTLAPDLPCFALITVEFPRLADGRGFSIARMLREEYRYGGEIRARGNFIQDQLFFLKRVGVNAFEFTQAVDLANMLPALEEFTVTYQAACDEKTPLYRRRNAGC
jgi:uncharacterized protein (DUF934 family)